MSRSMRRRLPTRIAGLIIFGFPQLAVWSIGAALIGSVAIAIGFLSASWVTVKWIIPWIDDLIHGPWYLSVEGDSKWDHNFNTVHVFNFWLRRRYRASYADENKAFLGSVRSTDPDLDEKIIEMRMKAQEVMTTIRMAEGRL